MNADTLNSLVAEWARADARRESGYCAPVAVLAERLATVHFNRLVRTARSVRADAYTDRDSTSHTYYVSFRDNRDASAYNVACAELATRAKGLGCKATVRQPREGAALCTLRVTLPPVADVAAQVHAPYVALLNTERAVLAARGV